jgi:trimethylamine--corrinoid protein Co-methyltransferase
MSTEYHYPHTADRATRADWEAAGSLDMRERARRHARQTLQSFFPEIVPEEIDRQVRGEFNILLPREVMRLGGYP